MEARSDGPHPGGQVRPALASVVQDLNTLPATEPSKPRPFWGRLSHAVSMLSLGTVFVLFIYGVAMRYLFNRPISWVDEAVTVLMVWSVLWTAALNLRWSEHISFDVVFIHVSPRTQRRMLLVVGSLFVLLMLAALPGLVEKLRRTTEFLQRELRRQG